MKYFLKNCDNMILNDQILYDLSENLSIEEGGLEGSGTPFYLNWSSIIFPISGKS